MKAAKEEGKELMTLARKAESWPPLQQEVQKMILEKILVLEKII